MPGPRLLQCLPQEQERLRLAVASAKARLTLGLCGLPGLEQLRRFMIATLNGFRPLIVRCSECEGLSADGYTLERGKGYMALCREVLAGPQERVDAVFFHELVHTCGGDELDSEGLECHCFRDGSTPPVGRDYTLFRGLPFRDGYHLGNYLVWNPRTGQVFVRNPDDSPGQALSVLFRGPYR